MQHNILGAMKVLWKISKMLAGNLKQQQQQQQQHKNTDGQRVKTLFICA